MSQLSSKNAAVLGISTDSVTSHKGFVDKEHLNFHLLADTDKKMTAAYGVLAPNGFANRVTFVIGPDGTIQGIDRVVSAQFARDGGQLTSRHGTNLALLLSDWRTGVGKPVPDFSLLDVNGKTVAAFAAGKKVSVVLFLGARSPRSEAYLGRLKDLAADPAYKEVSFLGLYPNAGDTAARIKAEAESAMLGFPVARDSANSLADHFGAAVTPSVWVIGTKGTVVYTGAIDDNPEPGSATAHYLKDAIDAALAGKAPPVAETKATGDPIRRASRSRTL